MLSACAFLCAFRGQNNDCTPFSPVSNVMNWVNKQCKFDSWMRKKKL